MSDPGNDPVNDPGNDPVNDPVSDPVNDPVSDPGNDPVNDPGAADRGDPDERRWLAAASDRVGDDAALGERIEVEQATSSWAARLLRMQGRPVRLRSSDSAQHEGLLSEAGDGWVLLAEPRRSRLVMLAEVVAAANPEGADLTGPGSASGLPRRVGSVYRRWARSQSPVVVALRDGSQVRGRVHEVLADAATLRTESAMSLTMPFTAVVWVTGDPLGDD